MLIMGSAKEAELIFWNEEDWQRVPVQGDPCRQGCYVLVISLYFHITYCGTPCIYIFLIFLNICWFLLLFASFYIYNYCTALAWRNIEIQCLCGLFFISADFTVHFYRNDKLQTCNGCNKCKQLFCLNKIQNAAKLFRWN